MVSEVDLAKARSQLISSIQNAADELTEISRIVGQGRTGASVPQAARASFTSLVASAASLRRVERLIHVREHSFQILSALSSQTNPSNNLVPLHGLEMDFATARALMLQSYLGLIWAACDSVCAVSGSVLYRETTKDINKLWTGWISKTKNQKIAGLPTRVFFETFGYTVAFAYAIRNHFVHEGACLHSDFFESVSHSKAFVVSEQGQAALDNKLKGYKVERYQSRDESIWEKSDLLPKLKFSQHEIDYLLSAIIDFAVSSAKAQTNFLFAPNT